MDIGNMIESILIIFGIEKQTHKLAGESLSADARFHTF
jgi:hypothetical protein